MKLKKIVTISALALALSMFVPAASALAQSSYTDEELTAKFDEEMHEARYICSRGAAYEYEGFQKYVSYWFQKAWSVTDKEQTPITEVENGAEIVDTLEELRTGLTQVVDDPEEVCWYIWGEDMPEAEGAADYDYTMAYDEEGFVPFLVPYLLEDQSQVKGNMVIVAGGGFNQRCNDGEGDCVAVYWNERGYNCYVLQRRVAPSETIDSSLDLQRAIRYIRYHAEELGIAKAETIIATGFSGGGMTILNQLNTCYGDMTPDVVYEDYQCDEIDAVNSDYPVAVIMYGTQEGYDSDNPNMPALFIFGGEIDNKVVPQAPVSLYLKALEKGWKSELYMAGGSHHGIGISGVRAFSNVGYTNAALYPALLETYLDVQLGYKSETFTPCGCVPVCTCEGCCDGSLETPADCPCACCQQ